MARYVASRWNEADRATWIKALDPTNREEVRRAMRQAHRVYEERLDAAGQRVSREEAMRFFNRTQRYWDRVK